VRFLPLYLLLFALGFGLVNQWLRHAVPERLKVEWYETIQDEVDVLFLGSSHVFRQFDPQLFDAQRKDGETPFRSINMAALGMGFQEQAYMLGRVLEENPPNLKWVVMEALPFELAMQNENDFGLRRIEWHDTATTWRLAREVWKSALPQEEKWSLLKRHGEHWWRRTLSLARGMDAVRSIGRKGLEGFEDQSGLGAQRNGYVPLEVATANQQSRGMRKKFRSSPQKLLQAVKELAVADDGGKPGGSQLAMVRELEQLAAQHGVGIIWWIHPNLERYRGWRLLKENGDLKHLIAYDDPEAFPEWYRVAAHFDLYHLNRQASERMTMTFAVDFVNLLEAKER